MLTQLKRRVKAVGKPQYWTEQKMGKNPMLHWCCGASLELDYYGPGGAGVMKNRLDAFCTRHESCYPGADEWCPDRQRADQKECAS